MSLAPLLNSPVVAGPASRGLRCEAGGRDHRRAFSVLGITESAGRWWDARKGWAYRLRCHDPPFFH